MLTLLYPLDENVDGYPREEFLNDLCDECEKDIRKCFAAGAVRVSIDFTEGRLACRNDPNNAPQEIADDLVLASKYIPTRRLASTDDCGFSPFSIDVKPKHGSPDVARDIAFQKIAARIEGTKIASERLGVA